MPVTARIQARPKLTAGALKITRLAAHQTLAAPHHSQERFINYLGAILALLAAGDIGKKHGDEEQDANGGNLVLGFHTRDSHAGLNDADEH